MIQKRAWDQLTDMEKSIMEEALSRHTTTAIAGTQGGVISTRLEEWGLLRLVNTDGRYIQYRLTNAGLKTFPSDFAALDDFTTKGLMGNNIAILIAARLVLNAVEFDEDNAMLNIKMPNHEYGFELGEPIENPLANALVLFKMAMDDRRKSISEIY